jgi:O-antigen ligase/tetratricopeptide (TPR) repeat protein
MECVVLLLVVASPWAFGAVHALSEFILFAGVALLLVLWAMRMLVEGSLHWRRCPLALCLAGLFLLGVVQLTPLSAAVQEIMSPQAASLDAKLRPSQPEIVEGDEATAVSPSSRTVSLYPGATRAVLLRLLAVFALFAVVRNCVAAPASLRRLCVVAAINGSLLALFALVQFFSSPPDVIYWTFPTLGKVFGPFICRNHFPFYVNLCIGLSLGLLFSTATGRRTGWLDGIQELLRRPSALWVGAALALMLSSVALSLSRGGILSLLGAGLLCLALLVMRKGTLSGLGVLAATLLLAVGLLTWFGVGAVEARLATLWQGDGLKDERLPVWSRVLPTAGQFPVWGSGYGTFAYVEPLSRQTGDRPDVLNDHPHNEYLEMLIEGGAIGALLALLAIGLVLRRGVRAVRWGIPAHAGLALGGVFAFAAAALHSVADFGLHLPAIVVLLTVVAAQLMALPQKGSPASKDVSVSLWGLGPAFGAAAVVFAAVVLFCEGWKAERAERCRLAAAHCRSLPGLDRRLKQIRYFVAAAAWAPEDAWLQEELAESYEAALTEEQRQRAQQREALTASAALAGPGSLLAATSAAAAVEWSRRAEYDRERARLTAALRSHLRARDLCPLLFKAQVRLAEESRWMQRSDPPSAYLQRALLILPCDPRILYAAGLHEMAEGRTENACSYWRRSLECSDVFLSPILARTDAGLAPAALAARVVPDQPAMLIAAAGRQTTCLGEEAARPLFERTLIVLGARNGTLSAEEFHLKALAHRALGQRQEALAAYRSALEEKPDDGWRYEFAELLRRQGMLQEARRELSRILANSPGDAPARELYDAVLQEIAEGG